MSRRLYDLLFPPFRRRLANLLWGPVDLEELLPTTWLGSAEFEAASVFSPGVRPLDKWEQLATMNPWQLIQYEEPVRGGSSVLWKNENGTEPVQLSGDRCGRADDLSGNGRHHVGQSDHPTNGDLRGEYTGNSVSLLQRAHFFMGDLSSLNATGAELFVLWHTPPYTGGGTGTEERNVQWWGNNETGDTDNAHYPFSNDLIYENFGRTTRVDGLVPETGIIGSKHLYHIAAHEELYMVRQNGATIHEETSATGTSYNLDFPIAGKLGSSRGDLLFISATIYGWVIFDRVLTESERARVLNLLGT